METTLKRVIDAGCPEWQQAAAIQGLLGKNKKITNNPDLLRGTLLRGDDEEADEDDLLEGMLADDD